MYTSLRSGEVVTGLTKAVILGFFNNLEKSEI